MKKALDALGLTRSRKVNFAQLFEVRAFETTEKSEHFGPIGVHVLFERYRWMISSARVKKARYRGAEVVERYPRIMQVIAGSNRMNDGAADALAVEASKMITERDARIARLEAVQAAAEAWIAGVNIHMARRSGGLALYDAVIAARVPGNGEGERL